MPSIESTLLGGIGPQTGYGMPFGGPYTNVYGTMPGSQSAQDQYWQTLNRGYDNEQRQLVLDAFGGGLPMDDAEFTNAITYDPTTGQYTFDKSKLGPNARGEGIMGKGADYYETLFRERQGDMNEDRLQARQQLEALAQKRSAQAARTEQQQAEVAGFQRELARYQSPDLMAQMVNPQMQAASNQAMASANAAGMAGGSMGQAANRRAAMSGLGQQFSQVVPQAATAQANQNFQWQKAREGMINNYYGMQQDRAQRDVANAMAQTTFLKGLEEYEHTRDREDLVAAGSGFGQAGAFLGSTAPFFKSGGGAGAQGGG